MSSTHRLNRALQLALCITALSACGGGSSDDGPQTTKIFATEGGSLVSGTGQILVTVRDLATAAPISSATVWLGDAVAAGQTVTTDADGLAILDQVAGVAGTRRVSAGKESFSLGTLVTTSTRVVIGLRPSDRTAAGATVSVTGTVFFAGLQVNANMQAFDQGVGFDAVRSLTNPAPGAPGGTIAYNITAPANTPFTLLVSTTDAGGNITALGGRQFPATTTNLANQDITLPAAQSVNLPLSAGVVSNLPLDQTDVTTRFVSDLRFASFDFQTRNATQNTGSVSIADFNVPPVGVAAQIQALTGDVNVEIETLNPATGQSTTTDFLAGLTGATFPSLAFGVLGSTQVGVTGAGAQPTVTLTAAGFSDTNAAHRVLLRFVTSPNRQREWMIFVAGGSQTFQVPAVPANLTDEGLVSPGTYLVENRAVLSAQLATIDFDDSDLSGITGELVETQSFSASTTYSP